MYALETIDTVISDKFCIILTIHVLLQFSTRQSELLTKSKVIKGVTVISFYYFKYSV